MPTLRPRTSGEDARLVALSAGEKRFPAPPQITSDRLAISADDLSRATLSSTDARTASGIF